MHKEIPNKVGNRECFTMKWPNSDVLFLQANVELRNWIRKIWKHLISSEFEFETEFRNLKLDPKMELRKIQNIVWKIGITLLDGRKRKWKQESFWHQNKFSIISHVSFVLVSRLSVIYICLVRTKEKKAFFIRMHLSTRKRRM